LLYQAAQSGDRGCGPWNPRHRGYSPNGSDRLLGKRDENCFVNEPLTLALDQSWSPFAVMGDLRLS
jgi:hypothetical protein